jgi:hypothetical protein
MSFDPLDGAHQTLAIPDYGAVAALVLPDITGESYVDLRQHFFRTSKLVLRCSARRCFIQPVKKSDASWTSARNEADTSR